MTWCKLENLGLRGVWRKTYLEIMWEFVNHGIMLRSEHHLQRIPESWNMGLGGFVLGSLIRYLKGMRRMMFRLSGFYYRLVLGIMHKRMPPWP